MITALLLTTAMMGAPPRLLVMDPKPGVVAERDAAALQRLLIAELGRAEGVVVVASSDVAQLAELGSKQQLAGCETDACLAEIAGAMGAELVVISELAQLGSRLIWQLALFDQQRGSILSRATVQAADVDGLADGLGAAVATLLEPLGDRGIVAADGGGGFFVPSAIVAASGAVVAVAGVVGVAGSAAIFGDATYSTELRRNAQAASPAFLGTAIVGGVIAVVGGVGMATSAILE